MKPGKLRPDQILVCLVLGVSVIPVARAQCNPPPAEAVSQSPDSIADAQSSQTSGSSQTSTPPQAQNAPQTQTNASGRTTAAIQEEVGDRDAFYLRDRIVFQYDYKLQTGQTETNRFRMKLLYAFGPNQRMGVSVSVPVMYRETPVDSAGGSGDTDVQTGVNLFQRPNFHSGVGVEVTFQTASEQLLGGASTTVKPAWGFGWALSPRYELTGTLHYKQSIHTVRGTKAKQFEPDFIFNTRIRKATWFVEWDSYYDFIPQQFAQTMKVGVSRQFGERHQWMATGYYSVAINGFGTNSQYKYNTGLDVTWYPFPNR